MRAELLNWYKKNKRALPWRKDRNPYHIWISEVMLQQTTVVAVIPYYTKFLERFPDVHSLAQAPEAELLESWAGLGYYSRARNLHKASKWIATHGFPTTHTELIKLSGFGPYTSRAVASLAFNEPVGVLDGNVIRILTRVHNLKIQWWLPKERESLQILADQLAGDKNYNSDLNQAMMELGATICTPKKPLCFMCPWKNKCLALKNNTVMNLPLSKPRAKKNIWYWEMSLSSKNSFIYLTKNEETPFLRGLPFPEGKARPLSKKPSNFHIKHSVTKYEIYVYLKKSNKSVKQKDCVSLAEVKKVNPSSLMTKILKYSEKQFKIN